MQNLFKNFYNQSGRESYARTNYHWEKATFFSYSTSIGQMMRSKSGELYVAISRDPMSSTTSRHIEGLFAYCPFDSNHIIRVPFHWTWTGEFRFSYSAEDGVEFVKSTFIREIKNLPATMPLEPKANRRRIITLWRDCIKFNAVFGGLEEYISGAKGVLNLLVTKSQIIEENRRRCSNYMAI